MKKIIIILSMLTLFGCGTDNTDPMYDCTSDRDCSDDYYCIDRVCIYNPQCETNEDCEENEVCNEEYQCVNFWKSDTCLNKMCTEACETCGPYTTCYAGMCINACDVYYEKVKEYYIKICADFPNCNHCICEIQGKTNNLEECTEKLQCSSANIDYITDQVNRLNNFDTMTEYFDNLVIELCTMEQ